MCRTYCELATEYVISCGIEVVSNAIPLEDQVDACESFIDEAGTESRCEPLLERIKGGNCDEIAALFCPYAPPATAGPACK